MTRFLEADPYNLEWGWVTSDGYSNEKKEVLTVFNFDVSCKENINRMMIFAIGKIVWLGKHIPEGTKQRIVFDLRGQPLTLSTRVKEVKEEILFHIKHISEKDIKVNIEILI